MTTMKSSQTVCLALKGTTLELAALMVYAMDRDLLDTPVWHVMELFNEDAAKYMSSFPDYHDHTDTNVEARSYAEYIICTAFSNMMHGVPYGNLSKSINEWHTTIRVNEYPY